MSLAYKVSYKKAQNSIGAAVLFRKDSTIGTIHFNSHTSIPTLGVLTKLLLVRLQVVIPLPQDKPCLEADGSQDNGK